MTPRQTPPLCVSHTSGLVNEQQSRILCCAATSSDHSVNTNSARSGIQPTCCFKTKEKCIMADCGCTQGSPSPSTDSWRPQSLGCGWLGSGGSWRGRTPPGQTCGCWTCGPPLCAACLPCHLHPRVSPCHVGATAYRTKETHWWSTLSLLWICLYDLDQCICVFNLHKYI